MEDSVLDENLKKLLKGIESPKEQENFGKIINLLVKKEKVLKEREKCLIEERKFLLREEKSKSSTQWSFDTFSTIGGIDPIKMLIDEIYAENKSKQINNFQNFNDNDVHFLLLYSNVIFF